MTYAPRFHELSEAECLEQLASQSVGRLVFVDDMGPLALPVNFTMVKNSIVVRTSARNTIATHVNGRPVSFEVDDIDDFLESGWSVVARGTARFVESVNDIPGDSRPSPWAEGVRSLLVRIPIDSISGRRVLAA